MIKTNFFRLMTIAGAAVLSASALAISLFTQDVKIVKNPEAPTLAVKYDGAKPARIEIRINGIQAGSKEVKSTKNVGVVTFGFSPDRIQQGDNVIEALLFDAKGNVIAKERTTLSAQKDGREPVYLKVPKMGQTVQGAVEINVGFGMEMRDTYVSFFVDKQFRSMKNFPPYSYIWDTTNETNGWHEIEAWTFDATQSTRKSKPIRVYVNNPGGQTPRETTPAPTKPANTTPPVTTTPAAKTNVTKPAEATTKPVAKPVTTPKTTTPAAGTVSAPQPTGITTAASPAKPITATPKATANTTTSSTPTTTPSLSESSVRTPMGNEVAAKVPELFAESAGARITTPKVPVAPKTAAVKPTTPVTTKTSIKHGTRIAKDGTFSIALNGVDIQFDVQPRVEGGIPLTPFRHLFEGAGGEVKWENNEKVATGNGLGYDVWIRIGDSNARVNGQTFTLETIPFLEKGRTIVPLSFLNAALNFNIEFDQSTGHVLITTKK